MKKLTIFVCCLLCAALLGGCVGTTVVYSECTCGACDNVIVNTKPSEDPTFTPEGAVKTGMAIIASVSGENASSDADGKVSFDLTLAAVNVDENGIITACVIDSLGTDVHFSATGVPTADVQVALSTKNELGESYGMKLYAGSQYEWNEQAAALAAYAVGKSVEELKNGAITESGYAKDADLATSATIYLGGYVAAIEKAAQNARHLGAQAGDELKLASIHSLADSTQGSIVLNSDVTAITMNADTITSCYLDAIQITVAMDENGVITSDLATTPQTKNELGESYGMKLYAGAKYEWYEQAENFASYVTGKTADEIDGIAVTEAGKPADADLATSVTIAIGNFRALILKAVGA